MMKSYIILTGILIIEGVSGLKLVSFYIPEHATQGDDVELVCRYDLEGDALYSVKWYRNGQEFYRYIPTDTPSTAVFKQPGLSVNEFKSTESKIYLRNVDFFTTGLFRCEISGEAPLFQTASQETVLVVVNLPDRGPVITGILPRYEVGDQLNVSCFSYDSLPAAKLKWYINGEEAESGAVSRHTVDRRDKDQETSRLDLRMNIVDKHAHRGDLKLKCTATIASIYWKSHEESVQVFNKKTQYSYKYTSQIWSSQHIMKSISGSSRRSSSTAFIFLPAFLIYIYIFI